MFAPPRVTACPAGVFPRGSACASIAPSRVSRLLTPTIAAALVVSSPACHRGDTPLGEADSYAVYEEVGTALPPAPAAGLPLFREVRLDDARAAPIHRLANDGFVGELLRTDYLAKQLIRDGWRGRAFAPVARARAAEPTALILGGNRMGRPEQARLGIGFATAATFGGTQPHANVMWIDTGDNPLADPAFVQTASGRIARLIGERLAGAADLGDGADGRPTAGTSHARALIDGYALAMEVIGREWRVGEGPQGTLPPSAGTGTQRDRFSGVRGNAFVLAPGDPGTLRPANEMISDPGVIAAVIHRMAQATGVGRRVAPPEIYAPFVSQRVPPGISPAAVLGPLRNFQVKLLCAWASAILAGHPPHDLIDLVAAYGDALPAERADANRILVMTTYGSTVKDGGVSPTAANASAALAELTTLAAEVNAGRRKLRAALSH